MQPATALPVQVYQWTQRSDPAFVERASGAIIVLLIVAAFGVPAIWTRLKGNASAPETLGEFETRGIMTNTGPLRAREAAIQMLILPVLLVLWGLAVVIIAAIVA